MILRMIAVLILGVAIGNLLESRKECNKDNVIENLENLLEVYEVHEEELKDTITYYKDGMNMALEQNIELKKENEQWKLQQNIKQFQINKGKYITIMASTTNWKN